MFCKCFIVHVITVKATAVNQNYTKCVYDCYGSREQIAFTH